MLDFFSLCPNVRDFGRLNVLMYVVPDIRCITHGQIRGVDYVLHEIG